MFCSYIRRLIFKNSRIIDCTGFGISDEGHPDYIIESENKQIYVELKINDDALKLSQLKWFSDNKDKECKVLWLFIHVTSKEVHDEHFGESDKPNTEQYCGKKIIL